jgi:hypothetical protein
MPKLTERGVATSKPRDKVYRLSDGGGLLLEVRPGGGRAWLYRFQLAGRRRDMGLGAYPETGLAMARRKAADAARLVQDGADPIEARLALERADEAARDAAATRGARTFRDVVAAA